MKLAMVDWKFPRPEISGPQGFPPFLGDQLIESHHRQPCQAAGSTAVKDILQPVGGRNAMVSSHIIVV